MLIPRCAETEPRTETGDVNAVLRTLRVHVRTATDTAPREISALTAIDSCSKSTDPLWISAEVGAGAARLAQAIYERGADSGPFLHHDCRDGGAPAIPAGRGILFLSHVERLSADDQANLAAELKRSDMRHLEGLRTIPPMARVVAWSTASLDDLTRDGALAPDLAATFARLWITIPPLRNQPESIATFTEAVLAQIAAHEGLTVRRPTTEALSVLGSYDWPGNLAELRSTLERACLLADASHRLIEPADLPGDLDPAGVAPRSPAPTALAASTRPAAEPPQGHRARTMQEIEAEAIRGAIDHNQGNLVRAARELRIGRATLYRKLKKYGIPTRTERRKQMMS